jgi:hypothetical protein
MKGRYLLAIFCVASLAICTHAWAERGEVLTNENIANFLDLKPRSAFPGKATCMYQEGVSVLGSVRFNGAYSILMPGAEWLPLTPSVSEQTKRLMAQANRFFRSLKRPKKYRAKAQKSLKRAESALAMIRQDVEACASWKPASPNPTRPNPTRPNPSSPEQRQPGSPEQRQPGSPGQQPPSNGDPDQALFVDDAGQGPTHNCAPGSIRGAISGAGNTLVTLANDTWIRSSNASSGAFVFEDVPEGSYTLVAESSGASFGPAHKVIVQEGLSCDAINLTRRELKTDAFFAFRWTKQDSLVSGLEQSTKLDQVSAEGSMSMASDSGVAISTEAAVTDELLLRYNIALRPDELPWTSEHAERLSVTLGNLWSKYLDAPIKKRSFWTLTKEYLENDIEIVEEDEAIKVRITEAAFRYAALAPAEIDGVRGNFISERLLLALARFITRNGADRAALRQIFSYRFGINIGDGLWEVERITSQTTKESEASFQLFTGEELLKLAVAFAQLPKISESSSDTIVLLRRRNAVPHPKFKWFNPIVSYSDSAQYRPYIEIAREAFLRPSSELLKDPTQTGKEIFLSGLVAAMAGIMWDRTLSQELRNAWISENDWSYDTDAEEWKNSNPTEVGAMLTVGIKEYDPQGDFSTSVAKYLQNPEELKFRSPKRFEFLKLYIMHGMRYVTKFRDDLKFKVINLRPDFSYPGKIKSISVVVTGSQPDLKANLQINLEGSDPMEHGAQYAQVYVRNRTTQEALVLSAYAVNPDPEYGTSLTLFGSNCIPRGQAGGDYDLLAISLTDSVGNTRYQFSDTLKFKFKLSQPPPLPDPAALIPDSLKLTLTSSEVEGVKVPTFELDFDVTNPEQLLLPLQYLAATSHTSSAPRLLTTVNKAGSRVHVSMAASPYIPSGMYGIYQMLLLSSYKGLQYNFSILDASPGFLSMPLVELENSKSDMQPPELNLNSIGLSAQPVNPNKLNGATNVYVNLRSRDLLSGVSDIAYCLRSPLDRLSCAGVMRDGSNQGILPDGTDQWTDYHGTLQLPAGSAPGIWGLDYIYLSDRVGNMVIQRFTETVKFRVESR